MISSLSEDRDVFLIDLPGAGLSSREEAKDVDYKEVIEQYQDQIENWRIKLGLNKIILIGHSFGGYISSMYATHPEYCQYIESLHLISPLGLSVGSDEKSKKAQNDIEINQGFFQRLLLKMRRRAWDAKETPGSFYQVPYLPTKLIMKHYVKKRYMFEDQDMIDQYVTYYDNMFTLPISGEKYLHTLFRFPDLTAKYSITEAFSQQYLDFNTFLYYGDDQDWMYKLDAQTGIPQLRLNTQNFIQVSRIKGGHNINLDNPKLLTSLILENTKLIVQHEDIISDIQGDILQQDNGVAI